MLWKFYRSSVCKMQNQQTIMCCSRGKPSISDGTPLVDQTTFRSIVSPLQYLMIIRTNLTYAVGKVTCLLSNPTDIHFIATKRILRCIKGTYNMRLFFSYQSYMQLQLFTNVETSFDRNNINAFSDADWISMTRDHSLLLVSTLERI